jgi:hypothetical protein
LVYVVPDFGKEDPLAFKVNPWKWDRLEPCTAGFPPKPAVDSDDEIET